MKTVLFMFGGVSAEHEVSVVTGLQALEHLDRSKYDPAVMYADKEGRLFHLPGLFSRKGYLRAKRIPASFGRDEKGGFVRAGGLTALRPYAAFLAFHGGTGESGPLQGLLESCGIPFTSCGVEASAVAMNKWLTKEAAKGISVPVVPAVLVTGVEVRADSRAAAAKAEKELGFPVIVKPAHLGSSIGISVAKSAVELEKRLIEAAHMDQTIVVERFLSGMTEYNCAVRKVADTYEASEVERPLGKDEILSFADKYERGAKKTGGGMASLQRELPAKIPAEKRALIQEFAKKVFAAIGGKGMARIDFMEHEGTLYLTEVNPIPGSMAFYLWEASGIPYREQISTLIEEAVNDAEAAKSLRLDYHSDIIERFVEG